MVDGQQKTFYIGKENNAVTGISFETYGDGYSGKIFVMVGITPDGVVSGIKIGSQQETPGLGAKITEDDFCIQFKDKGLLIKNGRVTGSIAVKKRWRNHRFHYRSNDQLQGRRAGC